MKVYCVPILILLLRSLYSVHISEECESPTLSEPVQYMHHSQLQLARKTFPTGDPSFSVMQPFPLGIPAQETDPFLMCDQYEYPSRGKAEDPDEFPINWHPHKGMDIMSYLISGTGRHGDSLGNRGEFKSPGMQWISVGSGVEHAEGGGTPFGETVMGFQIWINVPSHKKNEDPRYGIEPPENIPVHDFPGGEARVLAGTVDAMQRMVTGPFNSSAQVSIIDFILQPNTIHSHTIPDYADNCLVYVWKGNGDICDVTVPYQGIVQLDASSTEKRGVRLQAGVEGMRAMLFAGKRLNEPITWRGPFVTNTEAEMRKVRNDYQMGRFPPKRVPWDYKNIHAFPQ